MEKDGETLPCATEVKSLKIVENSIPLMVVSVNPKTRHRYI
jgi:hypothetical protein